MPSVFAQGSLPNASGPEVSGVSVIVCASVLTALRFAGLLNPLDAPHHLRADAISPFREGITLKRPSSSGTLVNVGLRKDVRVPQTIAPNVRVTVAIEDPELLNSKKGTRSCAWVSDVLTSESGL